MAKDLISKLTSTGKRGLEQLTPPLIIEAIVVFSNNFKVNVLVTAG